MGSGKSKVREFMERYEEIEGISMDDVAKNLMNSDPKLKQELKDAFGEDVYDSNGVLDRAVMGTKVFSSSDNTSKANCIIHPRVYEYAERFEQKAIERGVRIFVKESALLDVVLSANKTKMDFVVIVDADQALRCQRVMKRNKGLLLEQIESRMAKQPDWRSKSLLEKVDYVIPNNGTEEQLESEVSKLVDILRSTS